MTVSLKAIIICDFKSFRGKTVIESFKPITAIVGNNGAGKSNFMDAMSFVMGESNAATLRIKRFSDLIHGAHMSNPVAQSAYVTLVLELNNSKEINFTRVVTQSATEYRINNYAVLRSAYMEYLDSIGLNVKTKSFLIYQGTSDSLAMKSPKEITQLLEEISSSVLCKADYERLKDEKQKIELDMKYINEKKKYHTSEKKQARLEKEEVERYKELERKCVEAKTKLSLLQLFRIKMQAEKLQAEAKKKEDELRQHEENKNQTETSLKELKRAVGQSSRRLARVEQEIVMAEQKFVTKESQFAMIKEQVSYLQKKLDLRRSATSKASAAYERHKGVIKELKGEVARVERSREMFENTVASQFASQDTVELRASQVEDYNRLKRKAFEQSARYAQLLHSLQREQWSTQNGFDNQERKRTELEDRFDMKTTAREAAAKRLEALEDNVRKAHAEISKENEFKKNAESKIKEYAQIKDDLQKVSLSLDDAYEDMKTVSASKKRAEAIKALQDRFSGIYGRLRDICKPSHSRYNVAASVVIGKNLNAIVVATQTVAKQCIAYLKEERMNVETFLPLDYLKVRPLKERLRNLNVGRNVKLLFDVLTFSPEEIFPAVLFVTKNTLVCDTLEDARMIAYDLGLQDRQSCVSLDGTLYRKDGTFSGGQSDLSAKAKTWKDAEVAELKSRKEALLQRAKEAANHSEIASDVKMADARIKSLRTKVKFLNADLESSRRQMAALDKELRSIKDERTVARDVATITWAGMDMRKEKMQEIEARIKQIEDAVFFDFCKKVGITNIRQFEGGELREYEERARKRQEFDNHRDRIVNLLEYETERLTDGEVVKCQRLVNEAEEKLTEACEQREAKEGDTVSAGREVQHLHALAEEIGKEMAKTEKEVANFRQRLGIESGTIMSAQAELAPILTNIKKLHAQWNDTLNDCKIVGLDLPTSSMYARDTAESTQTTTSGSSDSTGKVIFSQVDFSKVASSIGEDPTDDVVQESIEELTKKMADIEAEMKLVKQPNFKAPEKMAIAMEQLSITNDRFNQMRKVAETTKTRFSKVKLERYYKFVECLNTINNDIDFIYKALSNDLAAQAILMPMNSEEPYLDGLKLSCIPPGKRCQEMSCLSGGEKALSSMALMFAIQCYKRGPFVVLDEVDASLDQVNTVRLLRYIRLMSKNMQFILISLKEEILSRVDAIVGIAPEFNGESMESKVFTLSLADYAGRLQ